MEHLINKKHINKLIAPIYNKNLYQYFHGAVETENKNYTFHGLLIDKVKRENKLLKDLISLKDDKCIITKIKSNNLNEVKSWIKKIEENYA